MRPAKLGLGGAVILATVAMMSVAKANIIAQSANTYFSAGFTQRGDAANGLGALVSDSGTWTFNQFDPTLGTLTAVSISIGNTGTWNGTGTFSYDFFGEAGGKITHVDTQLQFSGPGFSLPNTYAYQSNFTRSCSSALFSYKNCTASGSTALSFVSLAPYLTGAALNSYIGNGTVSILGTMYTDSGFQINSGDNVASTFSTSVYGQIALHYIYTAPITAVPEPPAAAMFATGLLGLMLLRWKRR